MDAFLKSHWLGASLLLFGVAILIGDIDTYVPTGRLATWLEVGIAVLGIGGIFVWAYFQSAVAAVRNYSPKMRATERSGEKWEKQS